MNCQAIKNNRISSYPIIKCKTPSDLYLLFLKTNKFVGLYEFKYDIFYYIRYFMYFYML